LRQVRCHLISDFTGVTTSIVILPPLDGIVDTNITVTLHALDQYKNIVTQEGRSVTLVSSGSSTGGGVATFTAGVTQKRITDSVAETITLSLLDSSNLGVNIVSTQTIVFVVRPGLYSYPGFI
jgi:hypothetical protein